ncbi:alpha-amylase family glycosyl hydrolase [Paenibacillus qinlingensis]|uniref:alpha-amylase family glycosyl hydrolase n=1 Tax=Paenibacillus qinlingensis TaxID=1837343 RepID=UPI00156732C4|nr:alpha-amylase family glycosyl hydrolase [Paenibacillus qinlingensis]NQX58689.1 alpha-amylase [Paenibacillus qinlingensis]
MAKDTPKSLRNQVMYAIYIRNYSEQGTFGAVEEDLDRIQALGVDWIWILPIHPTGQQARIGELGSPYAIQNYREVNPEFGTLADFKSLVQAIHDKGMKCLIDVVYNHTSPDSWLAHHHPEYFYRNAEGRMYNRIGDWKDIIDLDYSHLALWEYQIDTLKMWAEIVDGFRCDVAPLVPLDFWLRAREEVAKINPDCLWLSESVEPAFIMDNRARGMVSLSDSEIFQAFDICYDYDVFEYFRGYLTGANTLSAYALRVNMQEFIYPDNYIKLRYLENHDQARAKDIIPDGLSLIHWTAFIYFQKGMTLLYAGQEYENDFRPDLFNRDTVNWDTGRDISESLKALYSIKSKEIFANSRYHLTALDESDILVGTHTWGEERLIGVFSCKGKPAEVAVPLADGVYHNLLYGNDVVVKDGKLAIHVAPIMIETRSDT